ncbi:adaptor protein MecA [Salipaludibacillus aurantiacus]|uniref:Adapter protein MecA 1/2 n=1 Tax=Salipaludibacillus aurantiacus TaxID=1601833 RepID=A0A1H9PC92_9BACI|nr:adaptor protein MecA [Salipaludibacillus aurantiacus]SER45193.1 adapter protein MecA 1/2 [Salipaludibacillus aurantiacus]
MRLERLAYDKMKIFLTYEDLEKRGITTDKTWAEVPVIDEMFQDMITEASEELNFDPDGPVVVEVFSIPAQGLVIIVTKTEESLDDFEEPVIEWQIGLDQPEEALIFEFSDIEHVIQLSKVLHCQQISEGALYHYKGSYFLKFEKEDFLPEYRKILTSVIREYANKSEISPYVLEEYGKIIFNSMAVKNLNNYFS